VPDFPRTMPALHSTAQWWPGDAGYDLAEILAHLASRHLPTGIAPIDDSFGGIAPGEVWTVAGAAGASGSM